MDKQEIFNKVFPNPTPIAITQADTATIATTIAAFVDCAKFSAFVPIFCKDYVGTPDRNDAMSLAHIVKALKKLAMSSRNPSNRAWTNLSPDKLFAKYSSLTPMLPNNVLLWGLNLVSQFHDGLLSEIQDLLGDDPRYNQPNLATLKALRDLRVAAVRIHAIIKKQEGLIPRTVTRRMKSQTHTTTTAHPNQTGTNQHQNSSATNNNDTSFVSPAETNLQRYQPQQPVSFPIDPATGFTSPHPVGHRGRMLCGSNYHVFSSCPRRNEPGVKDSFCQNLFAHKPQLWKLQARPQIPLKPSLLYNIEKLLILVLYPLLYHPSHLTLFLQHHPPPKQSVVL